MDVEKTTFQGFAGAAQQSALHRVDAYSGRVGGFSALRGGSHAE
jgi:hypothetical protein